MFTAAQQQRGKSGTTHPLLESAVALCDSRTQIRSNRRLAEISVDFDSCGQLI